MKNLTDDVTQTSPDIGKEKIITLSTNMRGGDADCHKAKIKKLKLNTERVKLKKIFTSQLEEHTET